MFRSTNNLLGYSILATDGAIGECEDFLVDEGKWTVRHMVANTRKWLPGRSVLIAPSALENPDWREHLFPVKLTKAQIKSSPPLDLTLGVTREFEEAWCEYFGWPKYWEEDELEESHLRSVREMMGYHATTTDNKEVGKLVDLAVNIETWEISFAIFDVGSWWTTRKVIVPPLWFDSIDWEDETIAIRMTREELKKSPEFDDAKAIDLSGTFSFRDDQGREHPHPQMLI